MNERFWVPDERRAGRGSSRGVAAEGLRGEETRCRGGRKGFPVEVRVARLVLSPGPRVVGTLTARSLSRPGSARRWEGLVVAALAVTAGFDRWRRFGGRVIVFSDASNAMGVDVGERERERRRGCCVRAEETPVRTGGILGRAPRCARFPSLADVRPYSIDLSCGGYW